jgi:hypothetical protein
VPVRHPAVTQSARAVALIAEGYTLSRQAALRGVRWLLRCGLVIVELWQTWR